MGRSWFVVRDAGSGVGDAGFGFPGAWGVGRAVAGLQRRSVGRGEGKVLYGAGRSLMDEGVEWVLNGTKFGTEGCDEERDGGLTPAGRGVGNSELISAGHLVGADGGAVYPGYFRTAGKLDKNSIFVVIFRRRVARRGAGTRGGGKKGRPSQQRRLLARRTRRARRNQRTNRLMPPLSFVTLRCWSCGIESSRPLLTVNPNDAANRGLADWGKLIGDMRAATAVLECFVQQAELIPSSVGATGCGTSRPPRM
jgi:hypothetical protein